MSELVERARRFNSIVKGQRDVIPKLLNQGASLANGNVEQARALACNVAAAINILGAREFKTGMVTKPGDVVYDPNKKYAYVYTGASEMTHSNATFFPGASGVYYWAIIPNVKDGIKVYPDVSGIIVAVKKDELWYTSDGKTLYRWSAVDNGACSWYPGQSGVHQWVKEV